MQRVAVDFNSEEGRGTIVITPQSVPPEGLFVGERVIIYEPDGDIECEAIVRHGIFDTWVAGFVEGTIRNPLLDG